MPPRPVINDALWKCLCPRYSQIVAGPKSAIRSGTPRNTVRDRASNQQRRSYVHQHRAPIEERFKYERRNGVSPPDRKAPAIFGRSSKPKPPLNQLHLAELYEQLRYDGAAGRYEDVMNIIRILIRDRREKPNIHMYTAMLHSYASCTEGTAGKLGKVLDDMEEAGVELDGRGAECVLEALAVHPDYLLRTDILDYMRARWFSLSDRTLNFVVAGMLRDRLFEQALEKLDDMISLGVKIEPWLWDKTMWMLLEFNEVEEAFYVLGQRQTVASPTDKLSAALWQALLDAAAKQHLAEATATIWNTQVTPGYLKPPTGTCIDALSVAARSGDVKLATDVFHVLASRNIALSSHHYEALMESYLSNNDLYAALTVVLYMHDTVLKVSPDALHPLFTYLSKTPSRPMEAFSILQSLHDADKKTVPVAAVNTCMHASIAQSNLPEAIEFYKALHTVCRAGPNAHTFNILLAGCNYQKRKELAMYFAAEMIERKISPDRLTYDRLILVCLSSNELDDALLYYEEMRAVGFEARRKTHETLLYKCIGVKDERAVALLKDYRGRGERGEVEMGRVAMFERLVRKEFEDAAKVGAGDAMAQV